MRVEVAVIKMEKHARLGKIGNDTCAFDASCRFFSSTFFRSLQPQRYQCLQITFPMRSFSENERIRWIREVTQPNYLNLESGTAQNWWHHFLLGYIWCVRDIHIRNQISLERLRMREKIIFGKKSRNFPGIFPLSENVAILHLRLFSSLRLFVEK